MLWVLLLPCSIAAPTSTVSIKFTDDNGYIRIDKGGNCEKECRGGVNWAGHCDYCGLSNGSPGFCCHSDGRGHCSDKMIMALGSSTGYQCVIPKAFDNRSLIQTRTLNVENCWTKCGRKRGWAGKCGHCGPIGYCCHADGRGSCPGSFAASLQIQGHTRSNKCVIPSSTISDMREELALGSACTDLAETQCRTLQSFQDQLPDGSVRSLSPLFRNCMRFFSTSECATSTSRAAEQKPTCITRVTNKCETEPKPSATRAQTQQIESLIDPSWNAYQKELFRYLSTSNIVAMSAVSSSMSHIDSSMGAAGMLTSLADDFFNVGMASNALALNDAKIHPTFPIFNLAISTLRELESAWDSTSQHFNNVNLKVDYERIGTITNIRSTDFDMMVANSGASFGTQSHVIIMYDQIFKSVAPWSETKSFILNSFAALDFMPWIMNDLMIAVSQVASTSRYGQAVENVVRISTELLSQSQLEEVKEALRSEKGMNMARNAAMGMEIKSRLEDEGVRLTAATLLKAMTSTMGSDPFNMDSSEWDTQLITRLAYTATRMAGLTNTARGIATNIAK